MGFLLMLMLIFSSWHGYAQIEYGSYPRMIHKPLQAHEIVTASTPDLLEIADQDFNAAIREKPYRIGVEIPLQVDVAASGNWNLLPSGEKVLRMAFVCKGAQALGVCYSNLQWPEQGELFLYSASGKDVAGAFTVNSFTGDGPFITRPLPGDTIILEYTQPEKTSETPDIRISGLQFIYRGFEMIYSIRGSGDCEVNIHCPEGDQYKDQKQSVVKILTTVAGSSFLCTGTIMNNTSQDLTPYILTANHCSEKFGTSDTASAADLNKWIFYFNYESAECQGNIHPSEIQSITGATFVASSSSFEEFGSDFYLLRLKQDIPARYNPYYAGWKRINSPPVAGVCIHHPQGDLKKISTFITPAVSSSWETSPDTHWKVEWAATANGHGVTEGGSSGAPLFDLQGLVTGTLTGGESGCANVTGKDYFGKISYSWEPANSTIYSQLRYWLDPANTGATQLPGIQDYKIISANIKADTSMIPVGGYVDFTDISTGSPTSWHWLFEGGQPSESFVQNPKRITYNSIGTFDVKLIVSNELGSDTLLAKDFIEVKALIFPNPTSGTVYILSKKWLGPEVKLEVIDPLGRLCQTVTLNNSLTSNKVELPALKPYYFLRLIWEGGMQTQKVIILKK